MDFKKVHFPITGLISKWIAHVWIRNSIFGGFEKNVIYITVQKWFELLVYWNEYILFSNADISISH